MEAPKQKRWRAPLITLAVSVALILLGCGLCSVGHFNFEGQSSPTANAGVAAFFIGVAVFLISILWLIIVLIVGPPRQPPPPPAHSENNV
ncbi:MAG: hypothetical protein M3O31_09735 [Acidobacteriota bacterium]|nr:hypothetical protein [Acidobacteriota bacterium]